MLNLTTLIIKTKTFEKKNQIKTKHPTAKY